MVGPTPGGLGGQAVTSLWGWRMGVRAGSGSPSYVERARWELQHVLEGQPQHGKDTSLVFGTAGFRAQVSKALGEAPQGGRGSPCCPCLYHSPSDPQPHHQGLSDFGILPYLPPKGRLFLLRALSQNLLKSPRWSSIRYHNCWFFKF